MKKVARMRRSRDRWKDKATKRAEQIREFRKTKARQQSRIERLQARIEALEQPVSQGKNGSLTADVIPPDEAMQTRTVCLGLVMQAVISFRAVPRVLGVFDAWGSAWVPHFSSVINWTVRLGLALLAPVKPMDKPGLAIIDHSLAIGIQKVLVVLRVPMDALAHRGGHPGDC